LIFSPGFTLIEVTTPATEEGTSMVALSVSSSRTGCSRLIVSPTLTSTRATSALSTFSPSSGTLKSVTLISDRPRVGAGNGRSSGTVLRVLDREPP
jgi:hypothetical protein